MNRSELIALLQQRQPHLPSQAVDMAVKDLINLMAETLTMGDRIEIRGFGSFAVRWREARVGRNPMTGASCHGRGPLRASLQARERITGTGE